MEEGKVWIESDRTSFDLKNDESCEGDTSQVVRVGFY